MAEEIKTEVAETPAPAAPETPVVETPTLSPILQELAELGFEGLTDEKEALARVVAAHKNLKNEFGTTLSQTLAELRQNQPTTPTPPAQEAQPGSWWNPPKVDTTLAAKYRNSDGSWKPEAPNEIRQQFDAYQAYHDRWANDLIHRPNEILPKLIREEAEKIVREQLGQTQQQQQFAETERRIYAENPWLFKKHPVTGQPDLTQLSDEGEMLRPDFARMLERTGDFELAWEHASNKHQLAKLAAQAKTANQAKTAEEINTEKKAALVRPPGLNRGGSLPAPSDGRISQRNPNLSLGHKALQNHNRNGAAV